MSKLKLLSLNVNGIRAAERKGFLNWLPKSKADIVCVQETKVHDPEILSQELLAPKGFNAFWSCGDRKGYSGVAVYSKLVPQQVTVNFGQNLLSAEGRVIQLEFPKFYLLNVYFPNGGDNNRRVPYKMKFNEQFLSLIKKLDKKKPVIFCGDVNTAHTEIDLARPKENVKNTGFLPEEREWIDKVIKAGFLDTLREFNKKPNQYTWWDLKTRARERNVGWRIDYFFISKRLRKSLTKAFIMPEVTGSDHCPVGVEVNI